MSPREIIGLVLTIASTAASGINGTASDARIGQSQTGRGGVAGGAATVMVIPDDYEEPPGGWMPACNAGGTVCAYHARKGTAMFAVVNGKPGPPYEDVRNIVVSRNGRVAYEAMRKGSWSVVADGQEGPSFDRIEHPAFSGETLAYVGERAKRKRVVFGNQLSPEDAGIVEVALSPDGQAYAYVARREQTMVFVSELHRNGKYVWEDNLISNVSFTRDGRLLFASRTGTVLKGRTKIMVDEDVMSEHSEVITALAISPDGRRIAAVGCSGAAAQRRCVLSLDGKTVREGAALERPVFAPDGQSLAYAERQAGGRWHVVVGERAEPDVDAVLDDAVFSPDGKRHAYAARTGTNVAVSVDGALGPPVDFVDPVVFSPDSNHFAYTASKAGKQSVVLDHVAGQAFTWTSTPEFDKPGQTVIFVAQEGRAFVRSVAAVSARGGYERP